MSHRPQRMHEICRTAERMWFPWRIQQQPYSFLLLTAWGWHDYSQNSGQYVQQIDQRGCLDERKKEVWSCSLEELLSVMVVPLYDSHGTASWVVSAKIHLQASVLLMGLHCSVVASIFHWLYRFNMGHYCSRLMNMLTVYPEDEVSISDGSKYIFFSFIYQRRGCIAGV